jgi:NADPH:quinone reductase-like Zn-dependent oxidoreductase
MRRTNGQGVDCVLNSLSGELLDASLECVKDYGHFCEIGKFDLQNNTRIGLKALEKNVSYHAIDLATMFDHPKLSIIQNS